MRCERCDDRRHTRTRAQWLGPLDNPFDEASWEMYPWVQVPDVENRIQLIRSPEAGAARQSCPQSFCVRRLPFFSRPRSPSFFLCTLADGLSVSLRRRRVFWTTTEDAPLVYDRDDHHVDQAARRQDHPRFLCGRNELTFFFSASVISPSGYTEFLRG